MDFRFEFFEFFEMFKSVFSCSLAVFVGPGGLKQLRETCRIHFHHSWYLADFMAPSYDQKTKKMIFDLHFSKFISLVFLNFQLWVKDLDILGCENGFYTSRSPWGQLHMHGNLNFGFIRSFKRLHKLEEFLEGEIFDEMIESLTLQAQEESLNSLN